jgi:hypothetical protein
MFESELSYFQVRHERIDVDAQRSLMRLSKNPATEPDAVFLNDSVRNGTLVGIFAEDQRAPALRALKLTGGWWKLIPAGQDAVIVLDPENLGPMGKPLIAFRRTLRPYPARIDAALVRMSRRLRAGFVPCTDPASTGERLPDVVPQRCAGNRVTSNCCCPMDNTVRVWIRAFIPGNFNDSALLLTSGPLAGRTAVRDPGGSGGNTRGLLTDQRTFDSRFTGPSARFESSIRLITDPPAGFVRLGPSTVTTDTAVVLPPGAPVAPVVRGPRSAPAFVEIAPSVVGGLPARNFTYSASVANTGTAAPFTTSVTATLTVAFQHKRQVLVSIRGVAFAFALELYADAGMCDPATVFRGVLNPPATTSGVVRRAFSGEAFISCGAQCAA